MSRFQTLGAAAPSLALAALLSVPVGLLTACGGGGGGEATAEAATPATPTTTAVPVLAGGVAITPANARPVAADALDAATSTDAAEAGGSFVTGVQVEVAAAPPATLRLAGIARKVLSMAPAGPRLATGVAVNETVQCSGGGSLAMRGDVSGEAGVRAGDTITLTANDCGEVVDGVLTRMSGAMTITIQSGSYNADAVAYPAHVVMTLTASNFMIRAGAEVTVHGDVTVDLTESSPRVASVVVSGTSMSTRVDHRPGIRSFTMKNYRQALAIDNGATSFTVTASVETANTRLGTGTLRYDIGTPAAITTNAAGDFTGGSMKVTGSASALLLTVTATNTFQLQVDANGDGTYEATSTATLAELQAQL